MSGEMRMGIMSKTWLQTARRVLPNLVRLSRQIRPTIHLSSVSDICSEQLHREGIKAILWDVDGTLMAHHAGRVDPSIADAFTALLRATDLRHAIVSNCQEPRAAELGKMFPGVPVVLGYEMKVGCVFRITRDAETRWWSPGDDRLFGKPEIVSPIRKPSAKLIEAALVELNMSNELEAVLLVGDQYFTDIVSANLAGVRSAKVPTMKQTSFPIPVKLSQQLETILYRLKYGRPSFGWLEEIKIQHTVED
tara:strand:+ start:384 stop:1133 length:750 start_codon:yes stop_codon:yes gene_type:complete